MADRLLFILKHRERPYEYQYVEAPSRALWLKGMRSGLANSARFVVDMLREEGVDVHMVEVRDNNDIDREVHKFKPTHVIIEAFWVVPEKFHLLHRLHPKVKWIIRNHRELPFLANEGIAIGWTLDYLKHPYIRVRCNAPKALHDMRRLVHRTFPDWTREEIEARVPYLPNFYPIDNLPHHRHQVHKTIRVGCFGAIRPLKNHLMQAAAALAYADRHDLMLEFHINGDRIEGKGEPILKNLVELFRRQPNARLVTHGWLHHHEFVRLVREMHIGMQVRFSETFNIVTADFVNQRIPVVVRPEVFWVRKRFQADPTDMERIVRGMDRALRWGRFWQSFYDPNLIGLDRYDLDSERAWLCQFSH